ASEVPEESDVKRIPVIQPEVEAESDGILIDDVVGLQLINVEQRIRGGTRNHESLTRVERVHYGLDRRYGLAIGQLVGSRLDEVDAVPQSVTFVAEKEKRFISYQGTPDGSAELIHAERQLRKPARSKAIKEITRVKLIIAEKFKNRAVEII